VGRDAYPFLFEETMKELVVDDQSTVKILGDSMDDTLSQHTEAELRTKPLENLKDAFESNLLSLVAGHDADADRRQRNREFVSSGNSGNYKHEKIWRHVSSIPQAPISSLVLP